MGAQADGGTPENRPRHKMTASCKVKSDKLTEPSPDIRFSDS